jgi:hypothetical protein
MTLNPFSPDRQGIQVSIKEDELRRAVILRGKTRNDRAGKISDSGQDLVDVDMSNVDELDDVEPEQVEAWGDVLEQLIYDELKR